MSRPTGLSRKEEEDDDAALIDSFFLPGGILDPDDEEGEAEVVANVSRFASSQHPGVSRVPSNPWSNEFLHEVQSKGKGAGTLPAEALNDSLLLDSNPAKMGGRLEGSGTTSPVPLVRPPPGYTNRPESQNVNRVQAQDNLTNKLCVESAQDNIISKIQDHFSALHPPSQGPVDGPPPGFEDKTIRRPHQGFLTETTELDVVLTPSTGFDIGENHVDVEATTGEEVFENPNPTSKLVRVPKAHLHRKNHLQANPFMAFIDPDSDEDYSETEKSGASVNIRDDSRTAGDMEVTADLDGSEEGEGDNEDEDINDSPFPVRILKFVSSQSTASSISTSSDSGSDQDESQHSYAVDDNERRAHAGSTENMDEITEALDSGVAVILDVSNITERGTKSEKTGKEDDHNPSTSASQCKRKTTEEVTSIQDCIFEKLSTMSLPDSTIQNNLREIKTNVVSQISVWKNTFQEYSVWMEDLTEVVAVLTAESWKAIGHTMTTVNKALAFSALFLFQVGKFALVEVVEEPKVTICYLIFYFMPYFCSLLLRFFVIPHWTPHFLTTIAVWSLCSQITAGPIHMGTISIDRVPDLLLKNGSVLSTETRPRDERACRTILRILRFVLPLFFFADGFSTEFGTIMGVSGSSRLTTAYMMSLVRKSLVSSPIGWVSWAMQVLLATHHPSSLLVDLLVLVSGLSSVRLIRYLEVRRSGNKKRHGKHH